MLWAFLPVAGVVMDSFAGAVSTAIACINSKRGCISVKKDVDMYRFAVDRVKVFATPGPSNTDLDTFADPPSTGHLKVVVRTPSIFVRKETKRTIESPTYCDDRSPQVKRVRNEIQVTDQHHNKKVVKYPFLCTMFLSELVP